MFILSFISSGLEFWSVNHISKYGNSELNSFLKKQNNFQEEYLMIEQAIY